MGSFFGIIAVAAGVYCLYSYIRMMKDKIIPRGIMVPRDVDVKKCKDPAEYIKMTAVPLLILGIALLIYGAAEFVNQYAASLGAGLGAALALAFAALVWFAVRTKKANETYF